MTVHMLRTTYAIVSKSAYNERNARITDSIDENYYIQNNIHMVNYMSSLGAGLADHLLTPLLSLLPSLPLLLFFFGPFRLFFWPSPGRFRQRGFLAGLVGLVSRGAAAAEEVRGAVVSTVIWTLPFQTTAATSWLVMVVMVVMVAAGTFRHAGSHNCGSMAGTAPCGNSHNGGISALYPSISTAALQCFS